MQHEVSERTMKVVHIISGLGQGGAEAVLYRLVTASQQQQENIVICLGKADLYGPRLVQEGVQVHCLGIKKGPFSLLYGYRRLLGLLRELKPDVVQTWMYHSDVIGGLAAKQTGVKAIVWGIRNSGDNLAQSSMKSRFMAWVAARLSHTVPTRIVSCAENAARRHKQWGYQADKFVVVSNGYDFKLWRNARENRTTTREHLGVSSACFLYGAVARWNPLKDHANLLAAFAKVVKQQPHARCVLVGEGMDSNNAALSELIQLHGLEGKLILLGRRDDVPQLMGALDAYVLSSKAEGFPNVVCEAMAAGIPCVVTDVGDAALIVGSQGVVVPARNADALAQGMLSISTEGYQVEAFRTDASQRIERLYSLAAMVHQYEAVWQAALSGQQCAPRGAIRLLMVINNPRFFLSHRLHVALAAQEKGYEVHIATMPNADAVAEIRGYGLTHHAIPMTRSGKNPFQELRTIWALRQLCKRVKPQIMHSVTIKPVIYGGIAARLAGVPAYVAAVSGLGYMFMQRSGGLARYLTIRLYRYALGHKRSKVIFQNTSDRDVLLTEKVVKANQVVVIRGSGVDLRQFYPVTPPEEPPVVVTMVSRLLKDKGVVEFVEAARVSQHLNLPTEWRLVGAPDMGNPSSVSAEALQSWAKSGVIQYLGERHDIAALYQQSHIAMLPSYREGLPKSLIEAAAAGLPIITTDVPGCRDAINAESGIVVPPKDAKALADAVQYLASSPELRAKMGAAGRLLAEQSFDIQQIIQQHLQLYTSLTEPATS